MKRHDDYDEDLSNLVEIFPFHNRTNLKAHLHEFASRHAGEVLDIEKLIQEILMTGTKEHVVAQLERKDCRIFPFYPDDCNDIHQANAIHKYVATSHFYKMINFRRPSARHNLDPQNAIQSIEYIENDVSTARFEECKRRLRGLLPGGDKEVLLFHGTDLTNIEGIFNNNFIIDCAPANRAKAMMYGRGIYMSDYPETCLRYGNVLILCRVLLGRVSVVDEGIGRHLEFTSDQDSKEVRHRGQNVIMRVIKTADQVLPYCVINLNNTGCHSHRLQSVSPSLSSRAMAIPVNKSMATTAPVYKSCPAPYMSTAPPSLSRKSVVIPSGASTLPVPKLMPPPVYSHLHTPPYSWQGFPSTAPACPVPRAYLTPRIVTATATSTTTSSSASVGGQRKHSSEHVVAQLERRKRLFDNAKQPKEIKKRRTDMKSSRAVDYIDLTSNFKS